MSITILEFNQKETQQISRLAAFVLSATVCWVLLPLILLVVVVACAIIPIVAIFVPSVVKIGNKKKTAPRGAVKI